MKSCLLCGVGGQGTVLASRIIAAAAIEKGLFARTAETIGMAQRGGCVVSHARIGEKVSSPLIPAGKADVIIGFEPAEVVRNLGYLKENGVVIVVNKEVQPVAATISGDCYSGRDMIEFIKSKAGQCIVIDGDEIFREFGSLKAMNVVLLGALAKCGAMGLDVEDIENAVALKVKAKFLEMNKKALALGASFV